MKRIKILLMALIVALISIAVLNPNAIYAAEEKRDLTYQRTRPYSDDNGDNNIDNEEYTFARHKDGQEFKYSIVKIFDYNKRELETPYKKFEDSFYCIRGGKGFGSVEFGDNSSANSTEYTVYTVIENMKSKAKDVIAKYKELYNINLDRTENITFNEKTYNNVNIYNAMLWIADNAYLPVSTDKYNAQEYKTELLTKIGIAKVNQGMITDDDLEVIQQLAFWYFANYDENGKNESVSTTNPTPVNWLAINESNDVFGTRRANYLNRIYQYFIEGALKEGSDSTSTIRETTNSDSVNIEFDKRVIGQQAVKEQILKAIFPIMKNVQCKPIVLLFYGNSGIGKTETAQFLTEQIGGKILRKQFSMYQNNEFANYLFGGKYNEKSFAKDLIARDSNVILLDEFDKAYSVFHSAFYQLFDEGIYEDQNYRVDVRHAIIICTSNYKSKDEIKEKLGDPIFNRFDGVIKFEDLSQEAKKMIAAKELKELDEEKIIPENVRKILVEQSTKLENAREIRRLIKDTKSLIEIREICK